MKKSADDIKAMKGNERIVMLTAYTCPMARCLERADIEIILVGDTWGMVDMGFSSTREVKMEHMVDNIAAVRKGAPDTHIIGDMPYQSDTDKETALTNAKRLIAAGADSIKLEGPKYDIIRHIIDDGIAVFGHTGLTPQTAKNFKQVGKDEENAQRIIEESKGLEKIGCFGVILEHIPSELAKEITDQLTVPIVGIGAGVHCDGQVLVINDLLGIGDYWPPFSKQYAHLDRMIVDAAGRYRTDVKEKKFPEN